MKTDSDSLFHFDAFDEDHGLRLDLFLATRSMSLSRSRIQELIKSGAVSVNQILCKASYRMRTGDRVRILVPAPSPPVIMPEPVEFDIVHEDDAILVVNKPAGLVVHPAAGHHTGTLVHGLLWHCGSLSSIGGVTRPGIVHRLDKDTSGLMVVAKNDQAHAALSRQFKSGQIKKEYRTLVHGLLDEETGTLDLPIARHPTKRKEMTVARIKGKKAVTNWRVIETFPSGFSSLSVAIMTGRTHQIRVHLSHMGHPVVGDPVYGHGKNWWKRHPLREGGLLILPARQMLHSRRLGFVHPKTGRFMDFEAPIPDDMEEMTACLRAIQ